MKLNPLSPAAFALIFLLAACQQQEGAAENSEDETDETPPIPVEVSNSFMVYRYQEHVRLGQSSALYHCCGGLSVNHGTKAGQDGHVLSYHFLCV